MFPTSTQPRVSDFFLRLADNPALLIEHARDPRLAMKAAGFTDEQITTLLAGGIEGVRQTLESEVAADPLRRHLVVTPRMTLHTPTPDPPDGEPEPDEPTPAESDRA